MPARPERRRDVAAAEFVATDMVGWKEVCQYQDTNMQLLAVSERAGGLRFLSARPRVRKIEPSAADDVSNAYPGNAGRSAARLTACH